MTRRRNTWTYEDCKSIAAEYTRAKDWAYWDNPCYLFACRKGWQRIIGESLGWKYKNYPRIYKGTRSYQDCLESARPYGYLEQWRTAGNKQRTIFEFARRRNWHTKIAEELGWAIRPTKLWNSYEVCLEAAKEHSSLASFRKERKGCYNAARRYGWMDQILKEMNWVKGKHSVKRNIKK